MPEPSFLDYLKSLFDPQVTIHLADYLPQSDRGKPRAIQPQEKDQKERCHPGIFLGSGLIFAGQMLLELGNQPKILPLVLYILGSVFMARSLRYASEDTVVAEQRGFFLPQPRVWALLPALFLGAGAFLLFKGNRFTFLNTLLWLGSIAFFAIAFWQPRNLTGEQTIEHDTAFRIAFLAAVIVILFFRLYQINDVPGEMYSDHAEKLLDVMDVVNGRFSVFFERNTGREAIQFYVTAFNVVVLQTGFTFLSLKIGTIMFGLLTLPFIYLLTRDIANKWAGLIAMFLAGIAYWPNVISRVALRYALYPLFTAPTLYFLFKGLRERNPNYLMIGGLVIGLGLHGYSSFRIVPLLVMIIFFIYFLSGRERDRMLFSISGLTLVGISAVFVFIPLFRYWMNNPSMFSYRAMSRLMNIENAYESSPVIIFLDNLWDSLIMPFVDNGQIWVHSIPNRPALDYISASLLFVGLLWLITRLKDRKNWEFVSLLVSISVLMMPSILSLAFPGENPSLNRSAGALVPIFIIIGIAAYELIAKCVRCLPEKMRKIGVYLISITLLSVAVINNYRLVFIDYKQQFLKNAWNTSEIGEVIADYIMESGTHETAYVTPYPHWVDTRLVGFNAGVPGKDFVLWREEIPSTLSHNGTKLFIYKPQDTETTEELRRFYPDGDAAIFHSKIPGREFIIYTVENDR